MPSSIPWYRRWAWALVAALGVLLAAFGAYVLFVPVDPADFLAETGTDWAAFMSAQPDAAAYLEREARLIAALSLGFGALCAVLAIGPLRRGDRAAWWILWLLPADLALITVVFFASAATALGLYYAVVAVVAAVGLVLALPVGQRPSDQTG